MSFYTHRFNLYLLALLLAATGCATHKNDQPEGGIRVHLETVQSLPDQTSVVPVLRSSPVQIVIGKEPIVSEPNLIAATLLDTVDGGFAVRVKFDESGSMFLEHATASNPGRHLVIFGQWGDTVSESRWLAAPIIDRRIADGTVTFTPDMSRDEALKLVEALNRTARKVNTGKD